MMYEAKTFFIYIDTSYSANYFTCWTRVTWYKLRLPAAKTLYSNISLRTRQ